MPPLLNDDALDPGDAVAPTRADAISGHLRARGRDGQGPERGSAGPRLHSACTQVRDFVREGAARAVEDGPQEEARSCLLAGHERGHPSEESGAR